VTGAGRQALVLVALGAAIGFGANALRPEPLPLSGSLEPPPPPEPGADLPVTPPAETPAAWEEGAFFLDIRNPAAWEERRVAGSFPFPADSFDDRYFEVVADFGTELPLVVYGAAADSFEVRRTAARLIDLGHADVRVVTAGLDAILDAGVGEDGGPPGGMP
jgi:rhodanese-related sulfurtransferase